MFQPGADWSGPPMAVLLNKADLLAPEELSELEAWYRDNCRAEQVRAAHSARRCVCLRACLLCAH